MILYTAMKYIYVFITLAMTGIMAIASPGIELSSWPSGQIILDVSRHQGTIQWDNLRMNSKIQCVYIKATAGSDYLDSRYKENVREARRNGFKVGSYHCLTSRSSVTTQFQNFVRNVNREEQDLLPVVDVEDCTKWTAQQLRDSLKVFSGLIEDYYGCRPIIYTSEIFHNNILGSAFDGSIFWIAKYSKEMPRVSGMVLWQCSEQGRVTGVDHPVDINLLVNGYDARAIMFSDKSSDDGRKKKTGRKYRPEE